MTDKERIIKGLECCIESDDEVCPKECPFYKECLTDYGPFIPLIHAALELLKEQEEKPHKVLIRVDGNYCPYCSTITTRAMGVQQLHRGTRFCPYCGKEVAWE